MGAITYPLFANWAWGGGWLSQLGANFGLGHGYADFAGSGVVHAVGGITALAVAMIVGPRIGKYNRDGTPNAIPGHDIVIVLTGCFILAFGWFGFNPGARWAHRQRAPCASARSRSTRCWPGCTGSFGALLYMWIALWQAGRFDDGQRLARRTGRDHRAQRLRQHRRVGDHRSDRRRPGLHVRGVRRTRAEGRRSGRRDLGPRRQRPVGRHLRRAVRGRQLQLRRKLERRQRLSSRIVLWRPGPTRRAVDWSGHASGLCVQVVLRGELVIDKVVGQRVSAEDELAGLDIPEMGALCYPEFVLRPDTVLGSAPIAHAAEAPVSLRVAQETA